MVSLETEFLTTKELAELLRIKERKVYDLVASGEVPCTRATGKLLFPRRAIHVWIASKAEGMKLSPEQPSVQPGVTPSAVFLGSHDPLLEWALRESGCDLAMLFDSSLDGLERFAEGQGVASGLHLYDAGSEQWNVPAVSERFSDRSVVLVEFARRQRGLILNPQLDIEVNGLVDLPGKRLVMRQSGAGSQILLMQCLHRAAMDLAQFECTDVARSEADAALMVSSGRADVTLGLQSLAHQYRLNFVPLIEERFDLLIDRRTWFEEPLQRFVRFCQSSMFQQKAGDYQGYDVSGFGRVWFNAEV